MLAEEHLRDGSRPRSDDMMVIRRVNVFPSRSRRYSWYRGYRSTFSAHVTTEKYMRKMEVQFELLDGSILDSLFESRTIHEIRHKIRTVLQIDVKVTLLNSQTLERTARYIHELLIVGQFLLIIYDESQKSCVYTTF